MVDASVRIWGKTIGAVSWDEQQQTGIFEYEPGFLSSGLDLSPIMMGLDEARRGQAVYSFPNLKRDTYRGLPGLLADSLPDNFGNRIIDEWLSRQGRDPETFSPIERLCYTGQRGMGALEFEPALNPNLNISSEVNVDRLLVLAGEILSNRKDFRAKVDGKHDEKAMLDILRVATSAGGARAKALIAKNDSTGEIRSGQVPAPEGFRYWLLKFDGVQDRNLERTANYGRLEYAYYKMAVDCGINMTECRLLEENNRAHFMTIRFDRTERFRKLHLQTLCGMAHFDYNDPNSYSYEQAFQIMRRLRLSYSDAAELFRRMVFNVVARNQDDHTKNISFLMDEGGAWSLAPAYDMTYAYDPDGLWTRRHQMSLNGKRDGFLAEDFQAVAGNMNIKNASSVVEKVTEVVRKWPEYAENAGVSGEMMIRIRETHRTRMV